MCRLGTIIVTLRLKKRIALSHKKRGKDAPTSDVEERSLLALTINTMSSIFDDFQENDINNAGELLINIPLSKPLSYSATQYHPTTPRTVKVITDPHVESRQPLEESNAI